MNVKIANRILAAACVVAAFGLSSCSNDDDDTDITLRLNQTAIEYDADGVWAGVATNAPLFSQNMLFSHTGEVSAWGLYQTGFTPARISQTDYSATPIDGQFSVMSGGGMSGTGTPYLAAYWNSSETEETPAETRSCRVTFVKDAVSKPHVFSPQHVYVNNNCYTYHDMLNGSAFSKKFEEGDFLTLRAHGVHTDGSVSSCDFSLADCKGSQENWFVTKWTYFDLTSLGDITELYFTMESSDNGQFGINTPTYFCIDRLTIRGKLGDL